jgi:hypothetical protein
VSEELDYPSLLDRGTHGAHPGGTPDRENRGLAGRSRLTRATETRMVARIWLNHAVPVGVGRFPDVVLEMDPVAKRSDLPMPVGAVAPLTTGSVRRHSPPAASRWLTSNPRASRF